MSEHFRSYLYVPANHTRRVALAFESDADAVVLDLEDSVPAALKEQARRDAVELLSAPLPKPTFIRINGPSTPWCREDVTAIAGLDMTAIRVPKCDRPEDIRTISSWLDSLGCRAKLQIIIESAYGVEAAYRLAVSSSRVTMIGLGEADLRSDLGVGRDESALEFSRARIVLASRAAGLANPVASVFSDVRNLEGLRTSTERVKSAGFFGRFAIHPAQVDVINEIYSPTEREVEQARSLLACHASSVSQGLSVVVGEGGMLVAPPMLENARHTLRLADALGLHGSTPDLAGQAHLDRLERESA